MNRIDIPDEVAAAMRAAAAAAPPYQGDLAGVRRRGRARRQRRLATVAGAAVLVIGSATVAVPMAVDELTSGQVVSPGAAPTTTAPAQSAQPAQRLVVYGGYVTAENPQGNAGPLVAWPVEGDSTRAAFDRLRAEPDAHGVIGFPVEVLPDGAMVELDLTGLPEIGSLYQVVGLPDGRLVVLGAKERTYLFPDGSCDRDAGTAVDLPLLIVEPDRSVSRTGQIRTPCQPVELLAADADTAYLQRGGTTLVAYDFATGDERLLLARDSEGIVSMSVAGGRVADLRVGPVGSGCEVADRRSLEVRVARLDGGGASTHEIPVRGCATYHGPIQLSPNGRYLAVSYLEHSGTGTLAGGTPGIQVIDLAAGEVVVDRSLPRTDPDPRRGASGSVVAAAEIIGIAWSDPWLVRVAWLRPVPDGVHWLTDLVEVETVAVP
ncbi:MAG TPA: hypothetical protein VIL37_00790 [Natronosporangium sp.]